MVNFETAGILEQYCRVGRIYPRVCQEGVLCYPLSEFDMIESCKECKKKL